MLPIVPCAAGYGSARATNAVPSTSERTKRCFRISTMWILLPQWRYALFFWLAALPKISWHPVRRRGAEHIPTQYDSQEDAHALSKRNRNVPVLNAIEMSPSQS